MQDCYIGTHMAVWFPAFLPITYIWHFSPGYPSPTPHCPSPSSPTDPGMWCFPPVSMYSHCSTPTYEWENAVSGFLFLHHFAENDDFQIHPYTYKGHELIIFYGCRVFHGVCVPHFPCPVYHWWAFGLVPHLCYCKQCHNEHIYACVFIIDWFLILWVYTQLWDCWVKWYF